MNKIYTFRNKELLDNAKQLRKEMTDQGKKLWYQFLRPDSMKWYKQRIFGNYIVDFYCAKAKLAIEIDGKTHLEESAKMYDQIRTEYLNSLGIAVIRYTNEDITHHFYIVCRDIKKHVDKRLKELEETKQR